MNLQQLKKEIREEYLKIKEEWIKHKVMNKCPICDSPKGHTDIEVFIMNSLDKVAEEMAKKLSLKNIKTRETKYELYESLDCPLVLERIEQLINQFLKGE